jgi:RND family efflux transporter MFP subunit
MNEAVSQQSVPTKPVNKYRVVGIATFVLLVLLTVGIVPRIFRAREARLASSESPVLRPTVSLVMVSAAPAQSEIVLPGNLEPIYTAALFARTDGYLDRRLVDIGAAVKKGQLIAVIDSPEVDEQLAQARAMVGQAEAKQQQTEASLLQAKANADLAKLTMDRDSPLGKEHALSQQVIDNAVQSFNARNADVAVAEANIVEAKANLVAAEANVSRLEELQKFEMVRAPFDGVITERNVERGDLIAVGPGAKPLFRIAQNTTMRATVDVPQSEAVAIKDGDLASVTFSERLGRAYKGRIVRNTNAIEMSARTMRIEVELDNRDGSLLPGMYANVSLSHNRERPIYTLASSALIVDQNGPRVVTIRDSRAHFTPVVLGRDLGEEVEILDGVGPSDQIVNSPSDLLSEGQEVRTR